MCTLLLVVLWVVGIGGYAIYKIVHEIPDYLE